MDDHEVSVSQLLEREGWPGATPPAPRSKLRVLAVMAAVVLGCGAAALIIVLRPSAEEHRADAPEETGVIEMPRRTDGVSGAESPTLPAPPPVSVPASTTEVTTTTTTPRTTKSSATPRSSSGPREERVTASATHTPTTSAAPTSPAPTTSPTKTCRWWEILWC